MLVSRVARRYAEALYTSVPAETGTDRFLADPESSRAALKLVAGLPLGRKRRKKS